MRRAPKEAQGIAAELARTKAALASAQDTIAWQRVEIDRLIAVTPPPRREEPAGERGRDA